MKHSFTILIVDDNHSIVNILTDIFSTMEIETLTAYSGIEALDLLQKQPVDFLLTDIRMPNMSGIELFREARKIRPSLPTYLMTGYEADDIIQKAMSEGIKKLLTKPLNIDLLISLIKAEKENQVR
jgi:DNA-binding NtrC family response regulator